MSNGLQKRINKKSRPIKRQVLAKVEGKRLDWQAQIGRRSKRDLFCGLSSVPTVLLKHVRSRPSNSYVTDHLWMTGGAWESDFQEGDRIEFCGLVRRYGNGEGYEICEPRDVKRI